MKTKANHDVKIQLMALISRICLTEYKKYRCNMLLDTDRRKSHEGKWSIFIIILAGLGFYPKFCPPTLEITVHLNCLVSG